MIKRVFMAECDACGKRCHLPSDTRKEFIAFLVVGGWLVGKHEICYECKDIKRKLAKLDSEEA